MTLKPGYLKSLRNQQGLSQDYVARHIDVTRPTYVLIEQGERELTLTEADKLARLYGINVCELMEGRESAEHRVKFKTEKQNAQKPPYRIHVPQKNIMKFRETLLYILGKIGAKPNIGETAIYKILYFIDFDYYEKFEEQLIGATYIKNHFGPTPVEFQAIAHDMADKGEIVLIRNPYFKYEQKKYLPCRDADLSLLTAREKELIDDVLARLSDKNAKELSDYSHNDIPWKIHKEGEVMNYESVFYRDHKYSVRNLDDEL